MLRKVVDKELELIDLREKGINAFTPFFADKKIIVLDGEHNKRTYYLSNGSEYTLFKDKLKLIYDETH